MAKAASDFLDAVLKGDTQRASARLNAAGHATHRRQRQAILPARIGNRDLPNRRGRAPPREDQAIVQCVLTDSSEGTPHSEEMCCLLRKVDNDWRVSGIAYGTAPDKPWTLTDFESGQNMPIPRQTMSGMAGTPGNGGPQATAWRTSQCCPPPVTPPAPIGMPPVGPSNVNSPTPGAAGLGMPAVGSPVNPSQPQAPYTAQEPPALRTTLMRSDRGRQIDLPQPG